MDIKAFHEIARQLEERGAHEEAQQLHRIAKSYVPANIIEAIRLLEIVQAKASQDPGLVNIAARASLLSNQIQAFYCGR